jgi:soluble cytochrome b562
MAEEQNTDQAPAGEQRPESELLGELQSLGKQLASAVKALWDSEDSRKLRQEIGEGFSDLGRELDDAVKSAQESEAAKQFSEQVKETMDKARESDLAGKLEEGLTTGLRQLNQQLSQMARSFDAPKKTEDTPAADAPEEGATEE